MRSIFLPLVSAVILSIATAAAAPLPAGAQYSFHGAVAKVSKDSAEPEPEKTFDLTLIIAKTSDAGSEILWLLDESGRGGWGWIDRAGRWSIEPQGKVAAGMGPALLYDRGDGQSVIPFASPALLAPDAFSIGARWNEGADRHEVLAREKLFVAGAGQPQERDVWKVTTANNYGHKRIQWIDDAGLVVGLSERVFMGRGDEYELSWKLAAVERLAPASLAAREAEFAAFAQLLASLKREPRTESTELKKAELAALEAALPAAAKSITAGPLVKLLAAAKNDLAQQSGRAHEVADMAAKFVGRPAPAFALQGLAGVKLSDAELKGQVTILHFWDYRDEPLREPYGQIGYLDFLYEKRKGDGIRVFGVAVDARLADATKRAAARRSAGKLVSFMNLSYPILLDNGATLKSFGDPRIVGAQLPLFVVIDRDGRIVHYFVGCYEVDRDAGLKDLDKAVGAALQSK